MNEPKLRFPEFTGDWAQHILSDIIVDIADGPFGSNLKLEHYTDKKEARIIQLSNLSYYGWQEENTRYTTFEHAEEIKRCIVNEDELIMGKMMPAGMTIMRPTTDKMYVLSSDCVRIKLDKSAATDEFFLYTTKSEEFLNQIRSSSQGSTRIRISISKIKNMNLNIPSLPEQQKIGFLFTKLDTLIQSAQKELEGYRELKQGMLQKMFPKKGEKAPEIRFPEFTGDWEQRKLGDVTEFIRNGLNYKSDGDRSHKYKITRIESISSGRINTEKLGSSETINKNYELKEGDILFSHINSLPYIANTAIYTSNLGEIYHGMNLLNIRANSACISPYFLIHLLKNETSRRYFKIIAKPAVNQASISTTDVEMFEFLSPAIEEQERIASYFDSLDNLIASQQQELEGYKELKKGLLQQMFC